MKHLFFALLILLLPSKSYSQVYGCNNAGVGDTFQIDYGEGYGGGIFTYDHSIISWIGGENFVALRVGSTTFIYYSYLGGVYSLPITITPFAFVKPIQGIKDICPGGSFTVSDAVGGGIWSSSNPTVETVGPTGLVGTYSAGSSALSYSVSGYTCTSLAHVAYPVDPISGPSTVCVGDTIYLMSHTYNGGDVYIGGLYTSSDTSVLKGLMVTIPEEPGYIKGISAGTATVTYTDLYVSSCYATKIITVTPGTVVPAIFGSSAVCAGSSIKLSDSTTGGLWSIANTAVATINPYTGKLTGVSGGTDTVFYTVTSGSCAPTTRSTSVTVASSFPIVAPIAGPGSVCIGDSIILSDTSSGGIWSKAGTITVSVNPSTGEVTGRSLGTSLISYTITNACGSTASVAGVAVNPLPRSISGADSVCEGATALLSDTGGGTWLSSNTAMAVVGSTGVVTGISAAGATDTIIYTLPTGCSITTTITVLAAPSPIVGLDSICAGSFTTLSDTTSGGTWSSGVTAIAAIDSASGLVTGLSSGNAVISYTLASGCATVRTMSVNPLPSAIAGVTHVCPTDSTTLTDAGGGMWTSGHLLVASIDSMTGVITGVSPGSATISYTLNTGCYTTTVFTTDSLHVPSVTIVDTADTVCAGSYNVFGALPVNEGTAPHYQWKVNGTPAGTDTNYYYYIPADSDLVSVTLTSNADCAIPDTAGHTLMVHVVTVPMPTIALAAHPGFAISKGQPDTLIATVTGGGLTPSYQWIINGLPVAGATNAIFICDSLKNSDSVTCVAANSGACVYATFNSVVISVSTLGINPVYGIDNFGLYPNPNNGTFVLRGSKELDETISINIKNVLGQTIYLNKVVGNSVNINQQITLDNNIPPGIYNVAIAGNRGILVLRFIKE